MPKATRPMVPIDNFNLGGLSDSKWSGVKYSLYKMTGWNLHQIPGIARVAQKMVKVSGDIVTEFCKERVASTNGRTYWFSSESGKIWMFDLDGTCSLIYDLTPLTGQNKILGACEYQKFIYIATQDRLHKIAAVSAIDSTTFAASIVLNWAEFLNKDIDFHPMREQNLVLYIGDGNVLAQVDSGTFSNSALDIKDPLRIKSIGKIGTDILIGTYVSDNVTKTNLIRWNTYSGSFQVSNEINEIGVNAFLETDDFVYVQAGLWGRIYVYDYVNNKLASNKTISGEYSPDRYSTCYPSAVSTINGIALFGISNLLGNASDQGVFAIGRYSRNYPYIMDMPYPISEREDNGSFALSNIEIGGILVAGFNVFVSWRRKVGDVYRVGIDKLDYSTKLDGAYLETRVIANNRDELTNFGKIPVAYASLPTGCSIEVAYSPNYKAFQDCTIKVDEDRNIVLTDEDTIDASTLQIRIIVHTNGNNGPELESSGVLLR